MKKINLLVVALAAAVAVCMAGCSDPKKTEESSVETGTSIELSGTETEQKATDKSTPKKKTSSASKKKTSASSSSSKTENAVETKSEADTKKDGDKKNGDTVETSTSTDKKETNNAGGGSQTSKPNSSNPSTPKPTTKPSGNTGSSGNNNSGSSGNNSGGSNTPAPTHTHTWVSERVKVKDAWDERVLVKAAWDEQVLVKPAWSEDVYEDRPEYVDTNICNGCGKTQLFDFGNDINAFIDHACWECELNELGNYHSAPVPTGNTVPTLVGVIHHDAEYTTVHHDAEYTTVHHEAQYTTVTKCSSCGARK